MAQDNIDSTRVMPVTEEPIDRTMVASGAHPPAGATQMGATVACPVCRTTNPGLESYCIECGFLLSSTPGEIEEGVESTTDGPVLVERSSGRTIKLKSGINTVGRENW